ncbi:putative protein kinase [Trypanosoma rangeli]|uniref:Bifunctional NAD(P)H-hydrate repair enzyme n=1 Tax=Trypanosoma rangeli TaxID=5698 RepID=A0A3R7M9Q9_TRYRA|nr:putative protein kinase [Trypanosoma rangeli]RNE98724.1 putative protein kinase [Trypanosoma rangeli]|eukprot:RNE98724.1 putative protein kinase [Trypanosoma rangeli]
MLPLSRLPARCVAPGDYGKLLQTCVWRASWLREMEVEAAREWDVSLHTVMNWAAHAAFFAIRSEYSPLRRWLILCGGGNNGGDGYTIARIAADAGFLVTVLSIKGTKPLPPEATAAYAELVKKGNVPIYEVENWSDAAVSESFDLVVDALLGIGITGAPRGVYARCIDWANTLNAPRVAIDIPSGLNAETGSVEGPCIRAESTVTFIALKPGLLTGRARDYVGRLHYSYLPFGSWFLESERQEQLFCRRLSSLHLDWIMHPRSPCAHKGMNGKLIIIGGDIGFGGAVMMAAEAGLCTGAGLIRVLSRAQHAMTLLSRCPEVMVEELTEANLQKGLEWSTCVAVGPGLGQGEWGCEALAKVLAYCQQHPEKPSVWDADALNIMAAQLQKGGENPFATPLANRIITPHPGEAARLLQCTIDEVEKDRFQAVKRLAETYGGVALLKGPGTVLYTAEGIDPAVLKGPGTVLYTDEGIDPAFAPLTTAHSLLSMRYVLVDAGNSGMATGGFGDVLTGVIAGLLAQKFSEWYAACVGCLVHGTAGDLAAEVQGGERGLRATSLLKHIPVCVNLPPKCESGGKNRDCE